MLTASVCASLLMVCALSVARADDAISSDDRAELERLRAENAELRAELRLEDEKEVCTNRAR